MLFYRKNSEPMIEIYKEAPHVGTPVMVNNKNGYNKFYENDFAMSQLVGGYSKGPENSYANELVEKYPLNNK